MIDGLTNSRLFQYMRQAGGQQSVAGPAYAADRWVPSAPPAPASVDVSSLWNQLMQRYNSLLDDNNYVTGLYRELLGREPDAAGLVHHMYNLQQGRTRDQVRQEFLNSAEYKQKQVPAPAPAANLPPITIETVRQAAREFVAQHPEIANSPSYEQTTDVAKLREGVIAMLNAKGYRAGRVLGPDGKPYDQVIAFGNANDPLAHPYRVTAGGGRIERAIEAGYCDDDLPWSDVH